MHGRESNVSGQVTLNVHEGGVVNSEVQIVPVEGIDASVVISASAFAQPENFHDVESDAHGGSRGQSHHRYATTWPLLQFLECVLQLAVLWSEIVSPLARAMCFVHSEQPAPAPFVVQLPQGASKTRYALRANINQQELASHGPPFNGRVCLGRTFQTGASLRAASHPTPSGASLRAASHPTPR